MLYLIKNYPLLINIKTLTKTLKKCWEELFKKIVLFLFYEFLKNKIISLKIKRKPNI